MKKTLKLGILGLGEGVSILSAAVESELAEPYLLCDLSEDPRVRKVVRSKKRVARPFRIFCGGSG